MYDMYSSNGSDTPRSYCDLWPLRFAESPRQTKAVDVGKEVDVVES